jgi:hypothetical protein
MNKMIEKNNYFKIKMVCAEKRAQNKKNQSQLKKLEKQNKCYIDPNTQ